MPEPTTEPEPTVPGTMAAPTLKAGDEQLIATWTAPNNGGSPITAYELQYRTGDEAWTEITEGIGTNTSHPITGLTKAAEYDVQVRAVNAIGAGDWSESAAETPPATVPDAPDAPTLYAGTGRLVALWTAPEDDGGSPITGYELQYRTGNGAWTEIAPAPGTHDHSITNLTNDAEYEVRVRAVNEVGSGNRSESATAMPLRIQTPAGTAKSVSLSAAAYATIASENISVYLIAGTHGVDEMSGDITVTPATLPGAFTPPTINVVDIVNESIEIVTVAAATTAGTYVIYGETETEDKLFAEYFYVTVSPADNAELDAAVAAGITAWGDTGDLNYIITTAVTDMSAVFLNNTSFNGDISLWDVSSVTNMTNIFYSATTFNGDISGWDVSSVMDMSYTFYNATVFNGDISDWDVSSVTNMSNMFLLTAFNGDISGWDVSSVMDMSLMFYSATAFNGDISGWDVSSVTNMSSMFTNTSTFNQNLEEWKDHWSTAAGTLNAAGKYTGNKANMFNGSGVGIGEGKTPFPSWYE